MLKLLVSTAVLLVIVCNIVTAQDTLAFRSATAIPGFADKAKAIEQFVLNYPSSKLKTRAYDALFDIYVEQGNEAGALQAAHNSLQTLPPEDRVSPYNRFAYALALNMLGLDTALAYIDRAIVMAGTSRSLSGFQDTKAYVLFRLQRFGEAERLQRVAIVGHENDPEYLSHLANYEKENGKFRDALKTMAKALFLGADQESKKDFLVWIDEADNEQSKRDELKRSVIMATVHSHIDTLKGVALTSGKSNAAIVMSDLGVELPTAKNWAEESVKSLDKKSSIEHVIRFNLGLSLVLSAEQKYREALSYLETIQELVDPYETKYWIALATTHQSLGNQRKAIEAYMQGLIPRNDKTLRQRLENLYKKEFGTVEGVDKELDSLRNANANFKPGEYGTSTTPYGKVVLAELFTGAECGPCASSDVAFDALSEFYPRTALAIVEYHVHIPGPDPMTTNETWDRYVWGEGQGTPTVIIDGRESILGGGPRTVARNRFGVYRYAIQKFDSDRPRLDLSMKVQAKDDNVDIEVMISPNRYTGKPEKPALMVALVEKSVDYTGSNGISKHVFVVRKLIDGANGTIIRSGQKEAVTKKVNLADVEKSIKEYLDDPTKQRSWTSRRPFTGWRARPEKLDRANLAVVAWVQDLTSREVLQAVYADVPMQTGAQ